MLYKLLPEWLYNEISKIYNFEFITEIRLRINKPILVKFNNKYEVLYSRNGYNNITINADNELLNYIINIATKQSLYAYNNQIKHCYITTDSGVRIGICGEVVVDNDKVSTIKNISSLNIRIPHQIFNCSEKIIDFLTYNGKVKNTLIISPPGAGKTTLIRDIALKFSNEKGIKNILVVDERYEIAGIGINSKLNVGLYSDIISGGNKNTAFSDCIRTMSPSVIITDEISSEDDFESIKKTIKSGVNVVATIHANSFDDLKYKKYFNKLLIDKYFERYVVLSFRNGVGTVENVLDENFKCIYFPYML